MENVQKHFKEKRDDLYSRYRLAKPSKEKQRIIRDMRGSIWMRENIEE